MVALGPNWQMWPWVWLRGSGMSVAYVDRLAAPGARQAAQTYLEHRTQVESAFAEAIRVLEPAIEARHGKDRRPFSKAIVKLKKGTLPANIERLEEACDSLRIAKREWNSSESLRMEFEERYAADSEQIWEALVTISTEPVFREAVAWQNPEALRTGIDKIAKSKEPKYQRLVANYLQRYCTKNDTIGFFGPIAWGHIVPGPSNLMVGANLVAQREVFFSSWAVNALATRMSENQVLRARLAPRRLPSVYTNGNLAHYGAGKSVAVSGEITWLLNQCDAETSAVQIAELAVANNEFDFEDVDDVYETLEALQDRSLIIWELQVPFMHIHPERFLQSKLHALLPESADALATLEQFLASRGRLAQSAGSPEQVALCLKELDSLFEETAGTSATRNAGSTYGGRTIVFEDCKRDVELNVSESLLGSISSPLGLVLMSARWCSHEIAVRQRKVFRKVHAECGGGSIPLSVYLSSVVSTLPTMRGEDGGIVEEVIIEAKRKWATLLAYQDGDSSITLRSSDLGEAVESAFAAPGPGWPSARFHSPDFLISAKTLSAPPAPTIVLGELHAGTVTVFSAAVTHYDCPILPDVIKTYKGEAPIRIEIVLPDDMVGRASSRSMRADDWQVEVNSSLSHKPRHHVLQVHELVVEETSTSLRVVNHDRSLDFDIMEFFDYQFAGALSSRFMFGGGDSHSPRITIDNLVICRESWTLKADQCPFAQESRGPKQFLAAQQWRKQHRFPRWLFAKASSERKPMFVDLDSPLLIELLCNQIRKSDVVAFSEMLPAIDDNWLADAEDRRYTSELRTVVTDSIPWKRPD